MAEYWSAGDILKQTCGELGLPRIASLTAADDVQSIQLIALLNAAGNDLLTYYPWQQLAKEWIFSTADVDPVEGAIPLPADWAYFRDQTQWDRTDHWPLLGPKSPQEWAWLKGSLVAALPRQRFRVADGKFMLWPLPASPFVTMSMEYIVCNWIQPVGGGDHTSMLVADGDIIQYNPWMVIKFLKLKFYELKAFPTAGVAGDFLRIFNSLTGKDVGGKILSLSPRHTSEYLGPWSIPDGSWNVGV